MSRIVQGVYWLALGVWAGAIVMVGITAATAFRTAPTLDLTVGVAPYSDPAFADEAGVIVAGQIMMRVFSHLSTVQLICAIAAVVCMALQSTVCAGRLLRRAPVLNMLRMALVLVPTAFVLLDRYWLSRAMRAAYATMYDLSLDAAARLAASETFDFYHIVSERMLQGSLFMLIAAVLISPFVLRTGGAAPQTQT